MHPLSFGSSPPLSRLWSSITPSPSTPPCAPTVSGENLFISLSYDLIFISAMQILWWEESPWNIEDFNYFFLSLMRGLGRHWGDISSSSWGKETVTNSQRMTWRAFAILAMFSIGPSRVGQQKIFNVRSIFDGIFSLGRDLVVQGVQFHFWLCAPGSTVTCCAYPACATFPKLRPRWWSPSPRLWSSCRRRLRWAGCHWRHNRCSLLPAVSQMLPLAGQACRRGLSLPHHACGAHKPQKLETRADET